MEVADEIQLVKKIAIDTAEELSLVGILDNTFLFGEIRGCWTLIGSTKERGKEGMIDIINEHIEDITGYDSCHIIDKNNPNIQLKYSKKVTVKDSNKFIDFNPMYT